MSTCGRARFLFSPEALLIHASYLWKSTLHPQVEALERAKKRKADGDEADEKALLQEELPLVVLNPNVFTDFKVAGEPEVSEL